jgi:hypothetical protein
VKLGFFHHAFNVVLGQVGRGGNGYFLFLASGFILGGDVEDAVGVDVKGDFDLRNTARCVGDAFEAEAPEGHVI